MDKGKYEIVITYNNKIIKYINNKLTFNQLGFKQFIKVENLLFFTSLSLTIFNLHSLIII